MADKRFDLIVVGELNVDLILTGEVEPAFGQVEKLVNSATLALGSSSGIFACGAARLGLRTAFIGKLGDDLFGHFMIEQLHSRGIDTQGVILDPSLQTGLSVILARGADRAILTFPGSIPALRFDEVNGELLAQARHLHLGSYFLLDNLRPDAVRLFRLAHELGLTTSLDTNYDPLEAWDGGVQRLLDHTDIFLPNATELKGITGQQEVDIGLEQLSQQVPAVAVKLGAQGSLARCGSLVVQAPALPVQVADTVGAGDSFDAGFIYGHLAGWSLERTLQFATICGSLSTTQPGGIAGQPTLYEALEHLPPL